MNEDAKLNNFLKERLEADVPGDPPRLEAILQAASAAAQARPAARRKSALPPKNLQPLQTRSLNIISGSFSGLPNASRHCIRSIGSAKPKSTLSFSLRRI